jgi:hypothetical protein
VEAIPIRKVTNFEVIKFHKEVILSHFGCPTKIMTNNDFFFSFVAMIEFYQKFNIILGHSTPYF